MVIFISPVVFFFLVEIDRSLLSFFFVFKLVFIDFLRLQIWLKWHTRIRRGAANPAHWTGAANWRLGFPSSGLFSTLFIDLYGCHLFLKLFFFRFANWCFHFFFLFKLIEWCFTFENLFEVVNFYSDNFLLTAGDLRDCCLFQFYQSYKFYQFYQQINFFDLPFCLCCLVFSTKKNLSRSVKKGFI